MFDNSNLHWCWVITETSNMTKLCRILPAIRQDQARLMYIVLVFQTNILNCIFIV